VSEQKVTKTVIRGCIKSQKTDFFQIHVIPADAGISSGRMRGFLNSASLRQE